jgi:signal peptidase I
MLVICREYSQDNIKEVKFKKGDVLVFDDKNIAICINDDEVVMGRDNGAVVKQINECKDWNTLRRFRIDIKEQIKDLFVIYTNTLQ